MQVTALDAPLGDPQPERTAKALGVCQDLNKHGEQTMKPKAILWLVFLLLTSTWYTLDPAARGPITDTQARHDAAADARMIAAAPQPRH